MKLVRWAAGLVAAVVIIAFAVANREDVVIRFDPLPYELDLPVYALALGALLSGFLLGLLVQWLLGLKARGQARARGRRIAALEAELAALRRSAPAPDTAQRDAAPSGRPLPPPHEAA